MRPFITIIISVVLSLIATIASAQNTWLWAESIDRSNTWNDPYYKPYNTADKLLSYRDDSAIYCTDCSLPNLLWKGIEANKIAIYQLDKKSKLGVQKLSAAKTKLLAQVTATGSVETMQDLLHISEIAIYRRPDTSNTTQLNKLSIEWIALKIPFIRDTISLYLKSTECFTYLKSNECKWVHPLNHQTRLSITDALIQRNYIIRDFTIVSAPNLKVLPNYKSNLPPLAQALKKNDTHDSTGSLDVNKDNLLIRLQAIYSADVMSDYNRGFNKAHLVEFILQLHAENKIKGYTYHEAGYFTPMQTKDLRNHLLVETMDEEDITIKRFPPTALTQLHTLKTYTKISASDRITNDWLIFGLDKEISSTFNNRYAIAFKYEDVLAALSTTNIMWYNGKNEKDSMRLDEALRKQYIAYNDITTYSVYGDIIMSFTNDFFYEINSYGAVEVFLQEYAHIVSSDFKKSLEKVLKRETDTSVVTYQLKYAFTSSDNSVLTKNTLLTDALLDGIRTNSIHVYKDENLSQLTNASFVLNKLDKTRFYRTGNRKKDSIYISKIPVEDRFIKSSDLKEFTLSSNYTTIKKKSINQGFALGIFIPAELNPQYETDTLCYVSFTEFALFLQKNKAYKKLSQQFKSLLNERTILTVKDFYDILLYDVDDRDSVLPDDLPLFVRERIHP
ncbi:hypothetical protein [Cytophaga aurantiaca]|uniref:hypothetical protein n=1 Tax=Cytophaga aurantiaca TaxID=29530 RepID=UPI00037282D4|nr:hypothetical protein [Cytophaga aurantiaca]